MNCMPKCRTGNGNNQREFDPKMSAVTRVGGVRFHRPGHASVPAANTEDGLDTHALLEAHGIAWRPSPEPEQRLQPAQAPNARMWVGSMTRMRSAHASNC